MVPRPPRQVPVRGEAEEHREARLLPRQVGGATDSLALGVAVVGSENFHKLTKVLDSAIFGGYASKAMPQNTFVTTKYSTPSQVVTLVMPFPKLSLE